MKLPAGQGRRLTFTTRHPARPIPFLPQLEGLEGRWVPTIIVVAPGDSIQAAINIASPGDTISILPATHTEALVITKNNLHVVAGDGEHNKGDAGVQIDAPSSLNKTTAALIDIVGAAGVEINDLTLNGLNYSFDSAIRVRANGSATIHFNTIENTFNSGTNQLGFSIRVGDTGDLLGSLSPGTATIDSNILESYNKGGVIVDGAGSSATVTRNAVLGVGLTAAVDQNGLQISNGAAGRLQDNAVRHNSFDDPSGNIVALGVEVFNTNARVVVADNSLAFNDSGVEVQGSAQSNTSIVNNEVQNSASDGIILNNSTGVSIYSNRIDHGGGDGISLQNSNNNAIVNNQANNSSMFGGIFLGASNGNYIFGNHLKGNALDGIQLQDSSNNVLLGNITTGNQVNGIEVGGSFPAFSTKASTSNNNIIIHSISVANGLDGIQINGASNTTIVVSAIGGNGQYGINVRGGSKNTTIAFNLIAANGAGRINIDASSNAVLIKSHVLVGAFGHVWSGRRLHAP
jgi:parallel beta-helix repeat protein